MEYYLFASLNCNLKCNYCSVLDDSRTNKMPLEPNYSISNLHNFIFNTQKKFSDNVIDIIFFGGEPTLNYPYIYQIIDYFSANSENYKIRYILHTNGLLLNEMDVNYLNKINFIIISINYDKIPKDGLNNSYFSKIISNIKHVKSECDVHILGRLTITEDVSLFTNVIQVSNFFDSVYWQIENKYEFSNFKRFYSNYNFELKLIWDYWFSFFQKGFLLNFIPFTSQIKISNEKLSFQYLCGFNNNCIYIQNDGLCFSCPEEMGNPTYLTGDIWTGIHIKETKFSKTCKNCIFLNNCRGRCGRMHTSFEKSHIAEYCELNIILFKLFEENKKTINETLNKYPNLLKELENTFFDITEYIP